MTHCCTSFSRCSPDVLQAQVTEVTAGPLPRPRTAESFAAELQL